MTSLSRSRYFLRSSGKIIDICLIRISFGVCVLIRFFFFCFACLFALFPSLLLFCFWFLVLVTPNPRRQDLYSVTRPPPFTVLSCCTRVKKQRQKGRSAICVSFYILHFPMLIVVPSSCRSARRSRSRRPFIFPF